MDSPPRLQPGPHTQLLISVVKEHPRHFGRTKDTQRLKALQTYLYNFWLFNDCRILMMIDYTKQLYMMISVPTYIARWLPLSQLSKNLTAQSLLCRFSRRQHPTTYQCRSICPHTCDDHFIKFYILDFGWWNPYLSQCSRRCQKRSRSCQCAQLVVVVGDALSIARRSKLV